jgi:predicted negative regulator of RcsB-dependent stress response
MAKALAQVVLRRSAEPTADTASASSVPELGEVDPRFAAINEALQGGNGQQAMDAAKELLAALQKQKPPPTRLLNQARIGLAAGAMLAGDLDAAQKSLLSVNSKGLAQGETEQYAGLRDLLKAARQEAYSAAFQADVDKEDGAKNKGKSAAEEAGKLADLLQKIDPGNTTEISEARLKQANALLMGNNYRDAEKALTGVDEKSLADEQKEYLGAIRDGIHAQQIDALSKAYDYDMKRKNFKDAATNATVMVNNLAKYFPESKDHLVVARLQQATAQIMNGDMEDARKSLGRVDRDQLKQMDAAVGKRYRALTGAVNEHFENVKKEQALKAEVAEIESQLKAIDGLTSSGKQADAAKAVPMAAKLVATIQEKYPENDSAIASAKLTLANAKLAAGDMAGAKADLQAIVDTAKDPAIRDRAQLLQARAALKENQTDKAIQMLRGISKNGATPELQKAAKSIIISLEANQLKNVERKAEFEQKRLEEIREDKTPQSGWALLNPLTSVKLIAGHYDRLLDEHQANLNDLGVIRGGAAHAATVMKLYGLTLGELQNMKADEIAKLPRIGPQTASEIVRALHVPDVQQIARDKFDNLSWQNNTWYVDASYLDTEMDKAAKWIGKQVRGARDYDEELKASDSLFERAVGYTSGAILDAVSASNNFIKEKIKNASDFYNDPERKDTWYAALGRAGTFGADLLTAPVTMPATLADYKVSDAERSQALTGTLLMVGTMGVIKSGGPAWRSLGTGVSRGASGIAASRVGQWVATSELGQLVGATAQKLGSKAVALETRFEATGFAKGMDTVKSGLSKLNPDITRAAWKGSAMTVDETVDEIVRVQSPAEWRAGVTEAEITTKRTALERAGMRDVSDEELHRMVIGDKLYDGHYNPAGAPKPATISQDTYQRQLGNYNGPVLSGPDNFWHVRANLPREGEMSPNLAWTDGDVRRFYFNVQPDKAANLADHLSRELNRLDIQFQFKVPNQLSNFTRADAGVLYVEKSAYPAVKKVVEDFARNHPEALLEGSPAFTKPLGRGISAAEEPIQSEAAAAAGVRELPATPGRHSFGSSRSDIIAEVLMEAPANATKAEIKQLVRQRLSHYGFDPDRPWLKQGTTVDDLGSPTKPGNAKMQYVLSAGAGVAARDSKEQRP